MVADTVLHEISVVGVGRAEDIAQVIIVRRVLVFVTNNESDWCTCAFPLEYTREELHLVALLAGGGEPALPGFAACKLRLNEIHVYVNARRHTVNNASDGGSVALAEGGETEESSESIHPMNNVLGLLGLTAAFATTTAASATALAVAVTAAAATTGLAQSFSDFFGSGFAVF